MQKKDKTLLPLLPLAKPPIFHAFADRWKLSNVTIGC